MGCLLTKDAEAASKEVGSRGCAAVVAEEGPSCSTSSVAGVSGEAEEAPGRQDTWDNGRVVSLPSAKGGQAATRPVEASCGTSWTEGGARKWPPWLWSVAAEALDGWSPCDAGSFEKLSKIGTGTYSNVYKARDLRTGELVALKKVRFDNMDPESVQFMAREISLLRRLGCHPNVVGLRGIAASRVAACGGLYLVFDYMEHDLAGLAASPDVRLSLPQIKCYMEQLLAGLDHCHRRGVLHRDIKGANLLVSNAGVLKIADFGLACAYDPGSGRPMTSRVVTLWYRAPELLLGATRYGPGVDLWSAGCVLAELLARQPILPGRTEMDQLDKIFSLCGCPPEHYWESLHHLDSKGDGAMGAKFSSRWRDCTSRIHESFRGFPPSSLPLIETLLSIDPADRGTAAAALNSQFFATEPYPCDPASLPRFPPSKEIDLRAREEKRRSGGKNNKCREAATKKRGGDTATRVRRAVPAAAAAAAAAVAKSDVGMQINRNPWKLPAPRPISKSEKFPPPHRDTAIGAAFPPPQRDNATGPPAAAAESSRAHAPSIASDATRAQDKKPGPARPSSGGPSAGPAARKNITLRNSRVAPSHQLTCTLRKPPFGALMDIRRHIFRSDGP